jgi:hypothetical protein
MLLAGERRGEERRGEERRGEVCEQKENGSQTFRSSH